MLEWLTSFLPLNLALIFCSWRNIVEITFFSFIFYYIARWILNDPNKQLVHISIGYCFAIFASAYLQLPAVYTFLTLFAPVIAMLFILFHHKTLQKNFVTMQRYLPAKITNEWQQELIRLALHAHTQGILLHIIIEQTQQLDNLLSAPFLLNAQFQTELLTTLFHNQSFNQEKYVWLRRDGTIVSINAELINKIDEEWKEKNRSDLPAWQQDSIVLSSKTDAMIIASDTQTSDFTAIINGTLLSSRSAENIVKLIKNHTTLKPKGTQKDEYKQPNERQRHTP